MRPNFGRLAPLWFTQKLPSIRRSTECPRLGRRALKTRNRRGFEDGATKSVEAPASAHHIGAMGTFSAATVRLHIAALDLAEEAFLTLPEDDHIRSRSLENLHIARQMLAMNPPNIRATHQIFRELRAAFPNYDTANLPLARAVNAARDAAQPPQ